MKHFCIAVSCIGLITSTITSCGNNSNADISFKRIPARLTAAPNSFISGIEIKVENKLPPEQKSDLTLIKPELNVFACPGAGKATKENSIKLMTKDSCKLLEGTVLNDSIAYFYITSDQLYSLTEKSFGAVAIYFQDDATESFPIYPCKEPNHDLRLKGSFSQLTTYNITVNARDKESYGCILDS